MTKWERLKEYLRYQRKMTDHPVIEDTYSSVLKTMDSFDNEVGGIVSEPDLRTVGTVRRDSEGRTVITFDN